MTNMLFKEIDWDTEPVLARSLPQTILVLNCPHNLDSDDAAFQRLMLARFGAKTVGCVGYKAEYHLTQQVKNKRLTVEVVVWEELD